MKLLWITGIVIASTVIVSGCSVDWNDEKDKKIAELERRLENDAFNKNQECSKQYDWIVRDLKERTEDSGGNYIFEVIFYSPRLNTCVAAFHLSADNYKSQWYLIENVFTKETIYTSWIISGPSLSSLGEYNKSWRNEIKYLKQANSNQ